MRLEQTDIRDAFPFLMESGHIISLVGGGGKTTLMYALAKEYAGQGKKTLVMTTTHILMPKSMPVIQSIEDAHAQWNRGTYAVAGIIEGEKLAVIPETLMRALFEEAEAVLIEADGSRRCPLKIPADHEPVILPESDIVIGVAGLSGVGQTFESACFRYNLAIERGLFSVRSSSDQITGEQVAAILASERGTGKRIGNRTYYTVLNQCDTEQDLNEACQIAASLLEKGQTNIVFSHFAHHPDDCPEASCEQTWWKVDS